MTMAAATWRSSQPAGLRSPSSSPRRSYSCKTTPLAYSTLSFSFCSASTVLQSILNSLSRFTSDLSISPYPPKVPKNPAWKRVHMCAVPQTHHPDSFCCCLHQKKSKKNSSPATFGHVKTNNVKSSSGTSKATETSTGTSNSGGLTVRQFAIMNSQARSGTVEGDLVKRALTALTRSSSQKQCRRRDFQPRPSRLSVMSRAEDS